MNTLISNFYCDIVLKYANKLYPEKSNTKYTNDYYLKNIITVLDSFVSFSSLKYSKNLESSKFYHYKTIEKKHRFWSKYGVYQDAFHEIIKMNPECCVTEDIFIDSSKIINKFGSENVGFGLELDRKKKYSSITILVNSNKKLIGLFYNKTHKKELKNQKIIQTLPHDATTINTAIKYINSEKKYNLIGDTGYIINKKNIISDNVSVIYRKRKNQLVKNTDYEKNKLKKRYIVENVFAFMKRFSRLHVRRDRLISTYMGFVYLGSLSII